MQRTIHSPNEIVIKEDYAEIVLFNRSCQEVGRALIDLDKIDLVKPYKWYLTQLGYVESRTSGKAIYLHRFIMDAPKEFVIDHINHCRTDNRCCNLRICTNSQNVMNMKKQAGIWFDKRTNKYACELMKNYKKIWIGRFTTYDLALSARKEAEKKYFGEFMKKE